MQRDSCEVRAEDRKESKPCLFGPLEGAEEQTELHKLLCSELSSLMIYFTTEYAKKSSFNPLASASLMLIRFEELSI